MFGSKVLDDLHQELLRNSARLERLESATPPPQPTQELQDLVFQLGKDWAGVGPQVRQLLERVDAIEKDRKDLALAIGEGIERVDRNERRIQNTIRRAKRELAEIGIVDEGLEAEGDAIRDEHADAGDETGVLPMRAAVGDDSEAPSSIRGVPLALLKKFRGLG